VQVPFFFVNGVLTGMSTENPIVWYNPSEMINVRIVTIPVEDIFYNYAMLILVFVVYNLCKKRKGLAV
jgi:lycopene cyclase domain-containing protein